ncbi:hypothetical protein EVAR_87402_1, partial [Eumeta japonica]
MPLDVVPNTAGLNVTLQQQPMVGGEAGGERRAAGGGRRRPQLKTGAVWPPYDLRRRRVGDRISGLRPSLRRANKINYEFRVLTTGSAACAGFRTGLSLVYVANRLRRWRNWKIYNGDTAMSTDTLFKFQNDSFPLK